MLRRVLFVVLLCSLLPGSLLAQETAPTDCSGYDAYEWAQLVYTSNPSLYAALDPDGNGTACDGLPRNGFAPAIWTDELPEGVQEVQLVRLVDGDTLEVLIGGVSNRVRIYRADTPETQNETHCGGAEATGFAEYALSFNDEPNVVYLERDENQRDRYGRELAYVWFTVDGLPYMLNHLLIATGWAEDVDYGDRKYDEQITEAAAFAQENALGVYELCGEFGLPPFNDTQSDLVTEQPAAPAQQPPVVQEPAPTTGGCDPNYSPCVPLSSADLDCGDIGFSVTIIGGDPHGFDGSDNDGYGCESY